MNIDKKLPPAGMRTRFDDSNDDIGSNSNNSASPRMSEYILGSGPANGVPSKRENSSQIFTNDNVTGLKKRGRVL